MTMYNSGYKLLEHPSDLGIEGKGSSIEEAFQNTAVGLMSIIVDLVKVEPIESKKLTINASDKDQLLVKWLSEILYLYDGQSFVCKEFEIHHLSQMQLNATVRGERYSQIKHRTKLDVKAITYHQLFVQENDDGGLVRVFLDI